MKPTKKVIKALSTPREFDGIIVLFDDRQLKWETSMIKRGKIYNN